MRYPFPLQMRANMSNEAREWCTDDAVVGNALSRVVRDSEPNLNHTIVYISHATEQPSVVTDASFATTEAPSTTASAFPPLPSSMHDSEPNLN